MGKRTAVWIEINCDNCGKLFEKKESRLKYAKRHYCSLECSDQHKKSTMRGKNNHRYGKKVSQETKERRSVAMKERWKDRDYVDSVLSARETARKTAEHPPGWNPTSRRRRIDTYIERFGVEHNWADPDTRERCIETTLRRYGKTPDQIARESLNADTFEKRRRTFIETVTGVSYEVYEAKLGDKERYYKKVRRLTEQQPLSLLENYEKRGTLMSNDDSYHLDHIIPISYGWLNDIPEEIIADISNLRFIPARDNIRKGSYYEGRYWRANGDEEV